MTLCAHTLLLLIPGASPGFGEVVPGQKGLALRASPIPTNVKVVTLGYSPVTSPVVLPKMEELGVCGVTLQAGPGWAPYDNPHVCAEVNSDLLGCEIRQEAPSLSFVLPGWLAPRTDDSWAPASRLQGPQVLRRGGRAGLGRTPRFGPCSLVPSLSGVQEKPL